MDGRGTRECRASALRERVDHGELRETREIPVRGPEHTHAVKEAKGGDPGIVHEGTLQESGPSRPVERLEVALALGEEPARNAGEKPPDGIQGDGDRCGVSEDARIGDDRQELVDTGPRNADGLRARDRFRQRLASKAMERHLRAMGIDEQVRVDGDHAPRPR